MSEGERADPAADASRPESPPREHVFWTELVEIVEVIVLALVAIATAWSGYQAARWDGRQSLLYGTASTDRFMADAASTAGGQQLVADALLFTAWLQATAAHHSTLAALHVRRFTPDYRAAFPAWLTTDPLTNPAAPAGPAYMPQFRNPDLVAAAQLNSRAAAAFAQGNAARANSDDYVRDTVLFAAVLFLVAIAQRFKLRNIRVATTTVGLALLVRRGLGGPAAPDPTLAPVGTGRTYPVTWQIQSVTGVNDNGQIVANAVDTATSQTHALLLTRSWPSRSP